MIPYYSTFKTYHRFSYLYATLVDTTRLHIEGIGTAVYTLNGLTILTSNDLHIPALRGPIYSLHKHRQRPGCGVYSSYKDVSYLFFHDFILQVEDSYDNIFICRPLGTSHQGPINYTEPRYTSSTVIATPSGRPSTITPDTKTQFPHIIPSDEDSISYQPPLSPSIYIDCLPQPSAKVPPTEASNATLQKNSIETLYIRTLNMFHIDATNLPPTPPSSTPAPCNNIRL